MNDLNRRECLLALTALLMAPWSHWTPSRRASLATEHLASRAATFANAAAALPIGRAYLRQTPDERGSQALLRALGMDFADPPTGEILARRLEERQACDFETGELFEFGGWVLSRSEARLCALRALS